MSESMSLGTAIGIDAGIAYGVAVIAALCLPETRGRSLEATTPETDATQGREARSKPDQMSDLASDMQQIHARWHPPRLL